MKKKSIPKLNFSVLREQLKRASNDELIDFNRLLDTEQEHRMLPEYEEKDFIRIDDGCEGFLMDVEDFQDCARNGDLIDFIAQTLIEHSGDVHFYLQKLPVSELQYEYFFGKKNPYQVPSADWNESDESMMENKKL